MKLRLATLALCAVATTAATSTAFAQQGPKPEDQIRYRQSIMNVMGRQFGMLAGMAKGDVPYNKDAAVKAAGLVDTLHPARTAVRTGPRQGRADQGEREGLE